MSSDGQAPQPARSDAWARAFTVIGVVAILTLSALYVFRSLRALPGDAVDKSRQLLEDLGGVAAAFRQGTIETTFTSYATSVSGSNYLQFATLRQREEYTRADEASVLWGTLELPDVVVSATAPVEYTYYLDLDDEWRFQLADRRLVVLAPEIRFNRPAIDASEIRFEIRESSLLRDEDEALIQLKRGLTAMSHDRAAENVALVRELGRAKVREFVENWLAGSFGDGERYEVEIRFADERSGLAIEGARPADPGERRPGAAAPPPG